MGFDNGKITLNSDTSTYIAGQTLQGKLKFRQDKIKTFRGIYVEVKGYAHVHWTTRHSRRVNDRTEHYTVNHNADEEYFRVKQYLVGSSKGEYHLQIGDHEFSFQCHIPPHCSSSYDGKHGFVKYKLKLVVDREFKLDQEKELEFQVKSPVDLKADPYCMNPMQFSFEDTYCSWCVSAGCCETVVKLPQSGFYVGQTVPVELSCANKSSVTINHIKLQIVKKTTFHAHSQPGTKTEEEKVVQLSKGSIPGGTTRNWVLNMEIPLMDPCNLAGCRIIDVDYYFEVKVNTSGCHADSHQSQRVVIGDKPLNDTDTLQGSGDPTLQPNPNTSQNVSPIAYSMANNGFAQPQVPSPFLGGNPQYPGANAPYPGANPPYPGANPPYPGANPPYPGANPPYPVANTPYPVANPPYPGANQSYAGGNPPYPGSNHAPHVPYTGMAPPSSISGSQGFMPPYPGTIPMPLPSDPTKSPALGFRIPGAKPETIPLLAYSTDPTPVNPYASASAPAIDLELVKAPAQSKDTPESPTQPPPYNPEFMREVKK